MCAGGNLSNGANDGLFYWNLNNGVGNSNWNIGARLILCIFYVRTTPSPLGENITKIKGMSVGGKPCERLFGKREKTELL